MVVMYKCFIWRQTPENPGAAAAMGSQNPSTTGHPPSPGLGGRSPSIKGHTRNTSLGLTKDGGDEATTFEDKRKENFEAGRLELERRRKAIQEQHEKAAVSLGGTSILVGVSHRKELDAAYYTTRHILESMSCQFVSWWYIKVVVVSA